MKYRCKICGYVFDEAKENRKWKDLSPNWKCPICGAGKEDFEVIK